MCPYKGAVGGLPLYSSFCVFYDKEEADKGTKEQDKVLQSCRNCQRMWRSSLRITLNMLQYRVIFYV